jgi:hypothetical protein
LFLDAPHTSNLWLTCLASILCCGCDSLTQFEFELDEAFEIPGRSSVSLPPGRVVDGAFQPDTQGYDQLRPDGFAGMELTKTSHFTDHGIGLEHVDSLTLLELVLTAQPESVRDPYAYLDGLRFVALVNGQELELASIEGEALWQSGRRLVLPGNSTNLKVMLESPASISVRLKGNQPLGNRSFTVKARFQVDLF